MGYTRSLDHSSHGLLGCRVLRVGKVAFRIGGLEVTGIMVGFPIGI